jgi:D-xylulose kinase
VSTTYFIGIDAGTTSIKGILADAEGNILSISSREYALEMDGDRCEIDPEVYWEATKFVIRNVLDSQKAVHSAIRGLSFASQGETVICVDQSGVPLRKAIVWLDNRSVVEANEIEKYFGTEQICRITGQPQVQPLWPATRIAWLRKNEPEVFSKTYKFLLVEDYLIYKLTGKFISEQTLVSSTLYYDIQKKKWWTEMLSYLNISEEKLPTVLPSGSLAGEITSQASHETGLPGNISIITGAYDHVAGALGAGNYKEGVISETTGTSMAMVVTLDNVIDNFSINLPMQCHAVPGKYLLLPYGQTAGLVLKWFKEQFCQLEINLASENSSLDVYDLLTAEAEKIPAGCNGLIMLPHLAGSGSPEFDANAKGVFAGITAQTTKAHFIRAILEAVACMIKRDLDMLYKSAIQVSEIKALGGGSKSTLWNQIKADMTGVDIKTVRGQETAALGAVILASTGCGEHNSIGGACDRMVSLNQTFTPDPLTMQTYLHVYQQYVKLTTTLERLW